MNDTEAKEVAYAEALEREAHRLQQELMPWARNQGHRMAVRGIDPAAH